MFAAAEICLWNYYALIQKDASVFRYLTGKEKVGVSLAHASDHLIEDSWNQALSFCLHSKPPFSFTKLVITQYLSCHKETVVNPNLLSLLQLSEEDSYEFLDLLVYIVGESTLDLSSVLPINHYCQQAEKAIHSLPTHTVTDKEKVGVDSCILM